MYTSITPYQIHERQLNSEAFYELNPDHEPPTPEEDSGRFVLVVENGEIKIEWPWNPTSNGAELEGDDAGLKARLQEWMSQPEWKGKIGDLRLTVSLDEHNPQLIPFAYAEAARRRALKNHFEMDQGELRQANHDWALGCDPTSPFARKTAGGFGLRMRNRAGAFSPHFVHNPLASTDVCQHPALKPLSDIMASYPHPLEVDTRPIPQLTMRAGLGRLGADIVSLGIGHIEKQTGTEVPWALKTGLAAFWRGPPPPFLPPLTPHVAHRLSTAFRVALLDTTPIDTHSFPLTLLAPTNKLALVTGGSMPKKGRATAEGFTFDPNERISMEVWEGKDYLDVAFETENEEDRLGCKGLNGCEYLATRVNFDNSRKDASFQKYVLVFDGDDPTAAFESGSLILHSSPLGLSAWQTKAIPWHDYIPVSPDFSDLPSIVLFLRANDDVAERIAANGQAFGRKVLTKEAGMVAVAGELLEWARVWSVGRGEMDYVGHHR
ncbi:hypothetical protein BDY24DRAFT_228692 [Mrakia frigida]|uniref:uncharacterized protein n=1 Tax=Mrakia frigida TaxID=29902 RepID=UPI003FCBFEB2